MPSAKTLQQKPITLGERPQMGELLKCAKQVCETDGPEPSVVQVLMELLQEDYYRFHSPLPPPKGGKNWKGMRSVQLLFSRTVKINPAFRKRAERYVRARINFIQNVVYRKHMVARKAAVRDAAAKDAARCAARYAGTDAPVTELIRLRRPTINEAVKALQWLESFYDEGTPAGVNARCVGEILRWMSLNDETGMSLMYGRLAAEPHRSNSR
jgi:hypothetical protein